MFNNIIWVTGTASKGFDDQFRRFPQRTFIRHQHGALLCWFDPEKKSEIAVNLDQTVMPDVSLNFGKPERQLERPDGSGHFYQTVEPTDFWQLIDRGLDRDSITGRFVSLQCKGSETRVAADINASVSFFWATISGRTVFTTDFWVLVSLLPKSERRLDPESLYETLALQQCTASATMVSGISRLEPGQVLYCNSTNQQVHRSVWSLWRYENQVEDEASSIKSVKSALTANIEHLLAEDKNPAVLLSGGVDSGTVFGMINQIAGPIATPYTVRFASSQYDETDSARRIAKRYGTDIRTIDIGFESMFDGTQSDLKRNHDPISTQNMSLEYVVQQQIAANGHRDVWDGDFADALFGPLSVYRFSILKRLKLLPGVLRTALMTAAKKMWISQARNYVEFWEEFGDISLENYILKNGLPLKYSPRNRE